MAKKRNSTTWLLSWDCNGLEAAVNVTEIEEDSVKQDQTIMWATLANTEYAENTAVRKMNKIMQSLLLRARYNPQRHYEIYTIGMDASITQASITQMFNDSPQAMADLVRERGQKHYSDRAIPNQVKIT